MPITPYLGAPGMGSISQALHRTVFLAKSGERYLPGGVLLSGSASADAGNTGDVRNLRAGKILGKITSGGKYAPSIIGVTGEALDDTETTMTVTEAVGDEIVRRLGASGTLKIVGPQTAAGTVRTATMTYSAVAAASGGNRVVTYTALGVNEVQTLTFGAAATGGTYRFRVPLANGTFVTTGPITWDTTDATLLSNINTALDAATGVTGGIVATGATPDTTLIFTFSGTGYLSSPQPTEMISVVTFPTSATTATTVRTTTGVDGDFISGSFICPVDGSETPLTFLPDGYPILVSDGTTSYDRELPQIPVTGTVNSSQLIDWPSDTSLQAWLVSQLNASGVGQYIFDHKF